MSQSQEGPPVAPQRPVTHEVHGVARTDEFAWMRDLESPDTLAYLQAERDWYDASTAHLDGLRQRLRDELTGRVGAADESLPWRRLWQQFRTRLEPGDEYERLLRIDPATGAEQVVLDPNALAARTDDAGTGPAGTGSAGTGSAGKGFVGIGLAEPSPDGRWLAYSVDFTGDEVFELRFRDLATGEDLPEQIPRTYYTGAWSSDSTTFVYTVPDEAMRPARAVAHRLGTTTDLDWVLHVEPDRRFEVTVRASRDGRWLVVDARSRTSSECLVVHAADLSEPLTRVAERRPGIEYDVEVLTGGWDGHGADRLLVVTNDGAPEFRLLETALPAPGTTGDPADWQVVAGAVVPGDRLESASVVGGHVVLALRAMGSPYLRVLDRLPGEDGRRRTRELHAALPHGQVRLWRAEDPLATTVVVVEENLVAAPAWIEVDLATGARTVLKRTQQPGVDPTRYTTERIYGTAPDGARVPVTIARLRDLEPGASGGCLLYGYGAYETCSWPSYHVGTLSLLDRGVVYGVAHVRGGGELGRAWWERGHARLKQNSVDDLLAARDAVIEAGWAAEAAVVGRGMSAGGLLQAAAYSQAPSRWRATVAEVPFVDVVTTMCDADLPLTVTEWEEWGNPIEDPEDLAAMLRWSPYDNPPDGWRPPLLVTAALRDTRVLAHEPAKWVARLRATDSARPPSSVLLRAELGDASHGGPGGRFAALAHEAEILAWVLHQLGRDSD